ncbi:MAG: response regulator transcription factor [Lachnospiraceae bacterium]|nr:response regulator transcription factor [Lachnospiraceae bacterium]
MRILLIEDDEKLLQLLSFQLKKEGFQVDCCNNGGDAMYYISQNAHDIILLDRMLPEMDGLTILKKTRESGITIPVIMLTALGQLQDKIDGLDTGADDYLVKPFAFEELLARIRCIKRRPRQWEENHVLTLGDISLSPEEKVLTGPENSCTLSKRECNLLEVLLVNKNQTMPRMVLLSKVWGPDAEVEEGNLDNYIHFLRRRLKSVGSLLTLTTVRGVGYKLTE